MQRLAGPWLPHTLPLNTPLTNVQIRSYYIYRRRRGLMRENPENVPFFEISPLALDLDAEESPYVRPYVEETEGEPPPATYYSRRYLARHRTLGFEKAARAYDYNFKTVKEDKFSIWQISDYDVLSFILDPSFKYGQENEPRRVPYQDISIHERGTRLYEKASVLQRNGIPEIMQSRFTRIMPYILRRQHLARRLHPSVGKANTLGRALDKASREPDIERRFLGYERIIERVIQTPEGAKIVSESSSILGDLCEKIAPSIPPERLLTFLNNVVVNLEPQQRPISPILLRCAYQATYECRCLPMMQKYMGLVHKRGYDTGPRFSQALLIFQQMMSFQDNKPSEDITHNLLSIYGLLTGRLWGEDMSYPSFLNHMSSYTSDQFTGFLACLARLGAFRSMWYIWHAHPENITRKQASGTTVGELVTTTFPKDEVFTQAIAYAVGVNTRFRKIVRAHDFADTATMRHENCELELQTIIKSADLLLADQPEGNQPMRVISKGKISSVFGKKSLGEAMWALQSYLLNVVLDTDAC
ncbi:uncharacterized protein F4807DRAFT_308097 [Annulohypoxylon truncatum]|uniref:uncharacterized protein n=1 Tax=Annulohypoxylon truncatum TaxID=327061 RepID=UPI002007E349|nr:uncharacterized protein F4807DRAFT_308097 [Annulohypoxylon truncatum]KAI1212998.1 hypothetical protein F4807DRAFT_308097 [Annulohypoxylon truncatum]